MPNNRYAPPQDLDALLLERYGPQRKDAGEVPKKPPPRVRQISPEEQARHRQQLLEALPVGGGPYGRRRSP